MDERLNQKKSALGLSPSQGAPCAFSNLDGLHQSTALGMVEPSSIALIYF